MLTGVIRRVCLYSKENKWVILKEIYNIGEKMYLEEDWDVGLFIINPSQVLKIAILKYGLA